MSPLTFSTLESPYGLLVCDVAFGGANSTYALNMEIFGVETK